MVTVPTSCCVAKFLDFYSTLKERESRQHKCTYAILEIVRTPKFSHKLAKAEYKGRRARAVVARGQEKVPERLDMTQSLRTPMRAKAVCK